MSASAGRERRGSYFASSAMAAISTPLGFCVAGAAERFVTYPLDVVKTRQQLGVAADMRVGRPLKCAARLVYQSPVRAFAGCGASLGAFFAQMLPRALLHDALQVRASMGSLIASCLCICSRMCVCVCVLKHARPDIYNW
jgi:hypothetical protein